MLPTLALVLFVALSPVHRGTSVAAEGSAAPVLTQGVTPPGVPAAGGDRRHCVGGRQFAGMAAAPPCEPDWTGKSNHGATYKGVTATTVEVVFYRDKPVPALVSLQKKLGGYSSASNDRTYLAAAGNFVNRNYELWNRKVHIDVYEGNCPASNPDPACFNNDARDVVSRFHPFAVVYQQDTNVPTFFQTLSKLGVVNIGGWHFPASYDVRQRPFHYDVFADGDTQAQIAGQYWCRRLAGRPAGFAGDPRLRATRRKAAIITMDTNVQAADELAAVINGCDPHAARVVPYAPDLVTAINQSGAAIAQLRRAGVTDLLWYSDPAAPYFFTREATGQKYFPENVIVGGGLLDEDGLAQQYDPRQWAHAFGPSDIVAQSRDAGPDADLAWRGGGGTGRTLRGVALTWSYLQLVASGLQQAGPTLTPSTFEHGLLSLPPTGGDPRQQLLEFGQGDYTAISDARSVAWSTTRRSPVNGKPGTYVPLDGGRRFTPDAWPRSEPAVGSVER